MTPKNDCDSCLIIFYFVNLYMLNDVNRDYNYITPN